MTGSRAVLALIAAALVIGGLAFGLTEVTANYDAFDDSSTSCGSVLAGGGEDLDLLDTIGGGTSNAKSCREALNDRKPWVYGGLGLGVLAVLLVFVVPSSGRQRP